MFGHDAWFAIAKEEISSAKILLASEHFSTATYFCQQAAEKALKGYLVFKKQEITKTHDLTKLVRLCMKFDIGFEKFYDAAEQLAPFATKFRYPTEFDIPERDDAEQAVKHAQKILAFVLKKVSAPDSGQEKLF